MSFFALHHAHRMGDMDEIHSAALDASLYAGLRASGSAPNLIQAGEEVEESGRRLPGAKPVAMTSTTATAGIRTSGSPNVSFFFLSVDGSCCCCCCLYLTVTDLTFIDLTVTGLIFTDLTVTD